MSPLAYCRERAAPPGSDLHYALMFCPPAEHAPVLAAEGLAAELASVLDGATDPGVARVRLDWWRTEIAGESPRHPALLAVLGQAPPGPVRGAAAGALAALAERLDSAPGHGLDALVEFCARTAGALGDLAAEALGVRDPECRSAGRELRALLQAARYAAPLAGPGPTLRPGLEGPDALPELEERLRTSAARVLDGGAGWRPRAPAVAASLRLAALGAWRRRGCPDGGAALPPLRKVWLAWRAARAGNR